MKKKNFKGSINGKLFTNEVEFNKYLADVLAENGNNISLSISKATEIVEEDENPHHEAPQENVDDKNIFDVSTLELKGDDIRGVINGDIVDEIRNADNKDEIQKTLNSLVDGIHTANDTITDEIANDEQRIAEIKKEIESKKHQILINSAKAVYYEGLINKTKPVRYAAPVVHYPDVFDILFGEFWGLL